MTDKSELRALVLLAIPLAAQQAGFQLMGTVDAAMLGRYSEAALAGAGVGNNMLFAITSIGLGIVMGLDTVVPQALGAGRPDDARRALGAGIRIAILVGLVATLVMYGMPRLLELAGIDADVLHEARAYVYVRALGIVPFLLAIAQRSFLAAHHKTRPLIVAVVAGNCLNASLNLALIYGVAPLGIPPLGVLGAAIATTIVQVLTVVIYGLGVRALHPGPAPRSTSADLRAIVRYGGPVGGQIFAEVGIFGVATVLAAHLGKVSAAAHSIALNLASLTFSLAMGIASATSVRVGHAVGAGDLELARRRGFAGLRLGLAAMAVFAAAFVLVPASLAGVFSGQTAVIAATVPLLQIAALFQLSDGAQAIGAGALRGLGHTRETLWGNLVGHYAIGLPISLALAFGLGLGTPGLWWGLSAGLTVTAGYLIVAFMRGTSGASRN